jgi:hypothetical protein
MPLPIFVVADNGEANMIATANVNAATIPRVKEIFLEFIVIRSIAWSHIISWYYPLIALRLLNVKNACVAPGTIFIPHTTMSSQVEDLEELNQPLKNRDKMNDDALVFQ